MDTFINWATAKGYELPEADLVKENTKRSGVRGAYPDAYVRSQYPDPYFTPIAADAAFHLKNKNNWKG
jgi:hypothetical protein